MALSEHTVGLSSYQKRWVDLIEREFAAAGLPHEIAVAAVVNSWAESTLRPGAENPPSTVQADTRMYGLFQLLKPGGAGDGLARSQLLDPTTNTRRIIRVVKGSQGAPLLEAYAKGQRDIAKLAGLFAVHVERPKNKAKVALYREGLAYELFPSILSPKIGQDQVGGTVASAAKLHSAQEREMAAIIEDVLSAGGMPPAIIAAAIVNAHAESGLDPKIIFTEEDKSRSVGLFQLRDNGGLGTNMTVADRQDPTKNATAFLDGLKKAGKPVLLAYKLGERDVGRLAYLICVHVEQPAHPLTKGMERRALAVRLFPSYFTLRALLSNPDMGSSPVTWWAGLGIVGFIGWAGYRVFNPPKKGKR